MLGVLLQLKQGAGVTSLFDTDYLALVSLIVALIVYIWSLIGSTYMLYLNPDLATFMNKISLLFGALAFILELVILVPNLGLAALLFWIVWFVSFVVVYSSPYVKTLFTNTVAGVVQAFKFFKEYLNIIIVCFTVKHEEQIGLP